jgi:hypothetical protein
MPQSANQSLISDLRQGRTASLEVQARRDVPALEAMAHPKKVSWKGALGHPNVSTMQLG